MRLGTAWIYIEWWSQSEFPHVVINHSELTFTHDDIYPRQGHKFVKVMLENLGIIVLRIIIMMKTLYKLIVNP